MKKIQNAIDELFKVRQNLKMLKAEDVKLGTLIKAYMLEHGIDEIEAKTAYAVISQRPYPIIDPEQYLEALDEDWDKFYASISVRIDEDAKTGRKGARSYLGKEQIEAISESDDVPVLNIRKLEASSRQTPNPKNMKVKNVKVHMA